MEKYIKHSKNQVQYIPLLFAKISIKLVTQNKSREAISPSH